MTISESDVRLPLRLRHVTAYADARAVLDEPLLVPEPAADAAEAAGAPLGSLAWLRATVARFTGDVPTHARRRAQVEAELDALDPRELRSAAADSAAAGSAVGADDRHTVVRILAGKLGLPAPELTADAVVTVSAGYFGDELTPAQAEAADEAVASLLARIARADGPKAAAQRIGLLVQACDATARLVEHARRAARDAPMPGGVDALLAQVLRRDPPVTTLRRRALADVRVGATVLRAGDTVLVDVPAAQRDAAGGADGSGLLTFGAGPHRCPGQAQALALAAGLLERDFGGTPDTDTDSGIDTDTDTDADTHQREERA
ncbi:hypothetical protein [Streptacidiphilus anmyonensis]|uniref:hypothetical protein n=1 Tax=Streptacidiphilus anmyonensis TaxID=405782 RepID=UPI00069370C2|nr:hypothetical protein [Streptacidiphilus anmyonensis]